MKTVECFVYLHKNQYIKIINLDDVYVAIVAHKLNITLLNNKRFAIEEKKRTDVDNIMSSHEYKMRHF
jgi:hypothetical protein